MLFFMRFEKEEMQDRDEIYLGPFMSYGRDNIIENGNERKSAREKIRDNVLLKDTSSEINNQLVCYCEKRTSFDDSDMFGYNITPEDAISNVFSLCTDQIYYKSDSNCRHSVFPCRDNIVIQSLSKFTFTNKNEILANIMENRSQRHLKTTNLLLGYFLKKNNAIKHLFKTRKKDFKGVIEIFDQKVSINRSCKSVQIDIENDKKDGTDGSFILDLTGLKESGCKRITVEICTDSHCIKTETCMKYERYVHNYFDKQFIDWCHRHRNMSLKDYREFFIAYSIISKLSLQSICSFFLEIQCKSFFAGLAKVNELWQSISFYHNNFVTKSIDNMLHKLLVYLEANLCDAENLNNPDAKSNLQLFRYVVFIQNRGKVLTNHTTCCKIATPDMRVTIRTKDWNNVMTFDGLQKKFTEEVLVNVIDSKNLESILYRLTLTVRSGLDILFDQNTITDALKRCILTYKSPRDLKSILQVLVQIKECGKLDLDFANICSYTRMRALIKHEVSLFRSRYNNLLASNNKQWDRKCMESILSDMVSLLELIMHFDASQSFIDTLLCGIAEVLIKSFHLPSQSINQRIFMLNAANYCSMKLNAYWQSTSSLACIKYICAEDMAVTNLLAYHRLTLPMKSYLELNRTIKSTLDRYKGLNNTLLAKLKSKLFSMIIDDVINQTIDVDLIGIGECFYEKSMRIK